MSTTGLNLLNALFTDCDDVVRTSFLLKAAPSESRAYLFYCSGMCEVKQVNDFLKEDLLRYYLHHDITSETDVKDFVPFQLNPLSDSEQEDIVFRLFSGQIILYLEYPEGIYAIDAGSPPKRQPEEPSSELSIRGPKDGFIEEIMVNAALIRKRLRTNRLAFEQYQIGEKTNTRVGLMYLKETIEQELVEDIRRRLMNVRSTGLISAAQLEELLLDTPFNVFPKYEYTSRPDFAANALLHGRFMLLIDGVPSAIIAPTNLTYLLNAAEDANTPTIFV
ncbi:MAG: spore germination protein, partial [Clostridia bacterium]